MRTRQDLNCNALLRDFRGLGGRVIWVSYSAFPRLPLMVCCTHAYGSEVLFTVFGTLLVGSVILFSLYDFDERNGEKGEEYSWWEREDVSLYTLDPDTHRVTHDTLRDPHDLNTHIVDPIGKKRLAEIVFIPTLPEEPCDRVKISRWSYLDLGFLDVEKPDGSCEYPVVEGFTHTEGYFEKIVVEVVFTNPPYTEDDTLQLYSGQAVRDDVRFHHIELIDRIEHTDSINLKHLCGFYDGEFHSPDMYEGGHLSRTGNSKDFINLKDYIDSESLSAYTTGLCILPSNNAPSSLSPKTCLHEYGEAWDVRVVYVPPSCSSPDQCPAEQESYPALLCGL